MRVLIAEDDPALGRFLCRGLELDGHRVGLVADGQAALELVAELQPEVMILDLGLPRKDGMEVLAQMARRCHSTSVLVLTGTLEIAERVRCLELGAEDVMDKPFSFHELRARVKVLGRRRGRFDDRILRFGDLEMDRGERRVTQGGHEVGLTATEFSLLESLLRRGGERVCSRSELLHEVWRVPEGAAETGVGTNIVEVYINYVRGKLRRFERGGCSVIQTVRGRGYVLAAKAEMPPRTTRQMRGIGIDTAAGAPVEGWVHA